MWESYRKACFPDGCPAIQEKECRQAFFAGALSFFGIMSTDVTQLSDDDGAHALEVLRVEADAVLREYSVSNFSKGN